MADKVFAIYDVKASAYLRPFFMPTVGMAVRAIADCMLDRAHQFSRHPADFTLMKIGEFDDNAGVITAHASPIPVKTCLEIRAMLVQEQDDEPESPLFNALQAG